MGTTRVCRSSCRGPGLVVVQAGGPMAFVPGMAMGTTLSTTVRAEGTAIIEQPQRGHMVESGAFAHCTVATVEPMYEKPRPFFLRRDFSDENPDSYYSLFALWLSVAVGGLAGDRIRHGSTRMDLQPGRRQIRVPFLSF